MLTVAARERARLTQNVNRHETDIARSYDILPIHGSRI